MLAQEIEKHRHSVKKLEAAVSGFSTAMRDAAVNGGEKVAEVCAMILAEKNKAETEAELTVARSALEAAEKGDHQSHNT